MSMIKSIASLKAVMRINIVYDIYIGECAESFAISFQTA